MICDKVFVNSQRLQNHIDGNICRREHKCPSCNKIYKSKRSLDNHINQGKCNNTEKTRYSCKLCKSSFVHKTHYYRHMKHFCKQNT